ncbi:hypothetical protein F5Y17DRAFT_458652 [Xylariaceae sp. FL0594]|nr:hypothetical protein F5Y17DRAFT_458652 [Xylariaceae sp. FL0594]
MFWVMTLCIVMSTFIFLMLKYGSGRHQADLPEATVTTFVKLLWVYMLIWANGVFAVKVGILLFYWRVFQKTPSFRIAAIAVGFFSTGIFLSNFFSFTFQCYPVQKFWQPKTVGSCINQNAFYLGSAIINVFGDIAVLSLPLPIIWGLQASRSKKWSLSFLFLLGAFVIIASIFRIVSVTEIDPEDFSFTNVGGGLWSTVEVEVGFICANLPALRPLLFKLLGLHHSQSGNSGATPNYNLSKGGIRSGMGHIKLQSRNRDKRDLEADSSTEALNIEMQGHIQDGSTTAPSNKSLALPEEATSKSESNGATKDGTNTNSKGGGGDPGLPSSFADIVVQRDFDMSIEDDPNGDSAGGRAINHFVQITTSNSHVRIPAARDKFYGHRG